MKICIKRRLYSSLEESILYDVIVVGAGFSGLCSAALLSKKYNVLVLEKNVYLGGRAATRSVKDWKWADVEGYLAEPGHHVAATNGFLEFVLRKTGAINHIDFKLLPLPYLYRKGKFHRPPINVFQKLFAYRYMGIRDRLRLNGFLKEIVKMSFKEVIDRYAYTPLEELFDEFGLNEYPRELLTEGFAAGYQTLDDPSRNSAADFILCMKIFERGIRKYKTPLFSSVGGFGKIAEFLAKVVEENGGKVLLGNRVNEILVRDGKVYGVNVDSKSIESRKVLFAAPVYDLMELVDETYMDLDWAQKAMDCRKNATKLFLIIGGIKRTIREHPTGTWIMIPRSETKDVDTYYIVYEVSSELRQAPEGRFLLKISAMPSKEELRNRIKLLKGMENDFNRVFPEVDFENDFEWKTSVYFPIVDGAARTVDWYWKRRLGPETPVEGLYVCGDTTMELSSGVDGCASSAILAYEKISGEKVIDLEKFFSLK
ncbi:MAG: phytoene desaturase family protein [Candidatus Asgardarchaeia archaeon]